MNNKPVVIEFPLRGEWLSPTTPAKQVPSHGTNRMGLRYAFDFLQVNQNSKNKKFYNATFIRYLLIGVPLRKCYCWGEKIYAPLDGEVIVAEDGNNERRIVHWLSDSIIAIKSAWFFNERKDDYRKIAGNYIIIKYDEQGYMAFVHLRRGSINVSVGQKIKKGMLLGEVGHSGNSTSPHLHFQLMDSSDIANSNGIPCVFEEYELLRNDKWEKVYNQIPSDTDRFRFIK